MRSCVVFSLSLFLLLSSQHAGAQVGTDTVPTLAEILLPSLFPPNEALAVLFPPTITNLQTPFAIRYSLILNVPTYDVSAACHPVALSFLGTKEQLGPALCTPDNAATINAYITHALLQSQFPFDVRPYAQFLLRAGLNPFNKSTDVSTPEGWANAKARQLLDYFENDGWNSLGDLTRDDFRQPYEDSTRYRPENPAHLRAGDLRRPLRWQPLSFQVDQRGNYAHQKHIVPHIGRKVQPLTMSKRQFMERRVDSPYEKPNKWRKISRPDKKKMQRLIKKLFARSASLTKEQLVLSAYWENKFFSVASFAAFYQIALNVTDPFIFIRITLGEMMAQHDGVLLAWKEKVRHDLVRPTTIIRRLAKGQIVRAFRSVEEGVGHVMASEWEPVLPIQPHSEFPSASATLCTAVLQHLQIGLEELVVGKNGTLPPYTIDFPAGAIPKNPVFEQSTFRFETLKDAIKSCGESRLWAGVHFEPSVPAGFKLGSIGHIVFQHVKDLAEGRVPKNCARCIKE